MSLGENSSAPSETSVCRPLPGSTRKTAPFLLRAIPATRMSPWPELDGGRSGRGRGERQSERGDQEALHACLFETNAASASAMPRGFCRCSMWVAPSSTNGSASNHSSNSACRSPRPVDLRAAAADDGEHRVGHGASVVGAERPRLNGRHSCSKNVGASVTACAKALGACARATPGSRRRRRRASTCGPRRAGRRPVALDRGGGDRLAPRRPARHRHQGRLHQRERRDRFRRVERDLEGHVGARRVADEVRALDAEMVEQAAAMARVVGDADVAPEVAAAGVAGAVVADRRWPASAGSRMNGSNHAAHRPAWIRTTGSPVPQSAYSSSMPSIVARFIVSSQSPHRRAGAACAERPSQPLSPGACTAAQRKVSFRAMRAGSSQPDPVAPMKTLGIAAEMLLGRDAERARLAELPAGAPRERARRWWSAASPGSARARCSTTRSPPPTG